MKTFAIGLSLTRSSERTMIELGRSEEVILEMDRLANEDHTQIATEEEIDVYRGNWWIRSNFCGFRHDRWATIHLRYESQQHMNAKIYREYIYR